MVSFAPLVVTFLTCLLQASAITPLSKKIADIRDATTLRKKIVAAVDKIKAAREDAEMEAKGLPPRFAIPNEVSVSLDDGEWEELPDGSWIWRYRVVSFGAETINLGFTTYVMPEGGSLLIYPTDSDEFDELSVLGRFDSSDNQGGELWTPVFETSDLVVEVDLPTGVSRDGLELFLSFVNIGYRSIGIRRRRNRDGEQDEGRSLAGSCNVNVVCPSGDSWRNEISSVGVISRSGSTFCTGFMVNSVGSTGPTGKNYFMTADHCGVSESQAGRIVVYWNFQSPTCEDGSGVLNQSTAGATLRARYGPSDMTLLELNSSPLSEYGVTYAGWDNTGSDTSGAIAIHHPSGDEKSISFEFDPTSTTSYLGRSAPGDGTHVRVADWDSGTTEPGSSGSPLFDPNNRVIGQLHGGYAACSNNDADWYGKFSVSWTGGGTSASSLKDWLDPENLNLQQVDTYNPNAQDPCSTNEECPSGEICCSGQCKAPTCSNSNDCLAGPGNECTASASCVNPGSCDASCDLTPAPDNTACGESSNGLCCGGECRPPACETDSECGCFFGDGVCTNRGLCDATCECSCTNQGNSCRFGFECCSGWCRGFFFRRCE